MINLKLKKNNKAIKVRSIIFTFVVIVFISVKGFSCEKEDLADIILYSVRDSLELLDELGESDIPVAAQERISHSIITNILMMKSISPDYNELKSGSFETLCYLDEKIHTLKTKDSDKKFFIVVEDYLSLKKDLVKKRISEYQKSMRGKGCFISPK